MALGEKKSFFFPPNTILPSCFTKDCLGFEEPTKCLCEIKKLNQLRCACAADKQQHKGNVALGLENFKS